MSGAWLDVQTIDLAGSAKRQAQFLRRFSMTLRISTFVKRVFCRQTKYTRAIRFERSTRTRSIDDPNTGGRCLARDLR